MAELFSVENGENFENHFINHLMLNAWLSAVFPRGKESWIVG